jgi:hypothetical protein
VSGGTLFGLCAALLVGVGLYGMVANAHPLRKILAFNIVGSGVFLLLGAIARRGAAAPWTGRDTTNCEPDRATQTSLRPCGRLRADGGIAAGPILDDYRLAEIFAHLLADEARDGVGRAAGWKRHDDANGAVANVPRAESKRAGGVARLYGRA